MMKKRIVEAALTQIDPLSDPLRIVTAAAAPVALQEIEQRRTGGA